MANAASIQSHAFWNRKSIELKPLRKQPEKLGFTPIKAPKDRVGTYEPNVTKWGAAFKTAGVKTIDYNKYMLAMLVVILLATIAFIVAVRT
jgi:hypothetical protein